MEQIHLFTIETKAITATSEVPEPAIPIKLDNPFGCNITGYS